MALLERESETATLAGLLEAGNGAAVLIEGEAGIGKSALLSEMVETAGTRPGLRVLTARGTELELDLAFGGVRQLLAPVAALPAAERDALLEGPASLAGAVLGLREAAGGLSDPLYALWWLISDLAPVLLAIDDLHWLDIESARFVAYLAQRLAGTQILVAATARPNEPGAALQAFRAAARTVSPAPLSPAASAALAGTDDAHGVTGGNPFLLTELARGGTGVADSLARRIGAISPVAVALADAVALFPARTRLADVAAVAELGDAEAAAAADALVAAQVLTRDLEFVHPLMRAARYDALPPFARRRNHARAAQILRARDAPTADVAAHLLAGEPAHDAEHATILRAAADDAVAAVAPRAAVRYLERALEEGIDQQAIRLLLGRLQRLIGDSRAQETLEAAFDRGGPAAIELAATAFCNADTATVHRVVATMQSVEVTADERIVLDMLRAEALWQDLDFDACVEAIDAVPHDLPGDTPAQRMALAMIGAVKFMRGDPLTEVLDTLRRSVGEDGTAPSPVAGVDIGDPLQWIVQAEALDEAQSLAEERMEHARATGDEALFAATQNSYGWLLDLRGDLRGAEAAFRLGLEQPAITPYMRGHVTVNLAQTLVARGALDEAVSAVEGVRHLAAGHLTRMLDVRLGQVAVWRGDFRAGLDPLRVWHEHLPLAFRNPHGLPLAPEYANALAGTGRRDEAIALTRELVAASDRLEGTFGKGVHRVTLGRLTRDTACLEEAVAILGASPFRWHEARARLELGRALRRDARRADCREHLQLALDYAEPNGADLLAEQAREELLLAGARPRRVLRTGADSLTPAEARIARLAADGMSNKDIAAHLFVTVGTVQTTLVRVYRKLDVGSRRDLAAAMAS